MNPPPFRRILVVDDEPNIVSAVRRELSTPPLGRYRYEVEGFTDAAEALACARSQDFDAAICDYRMPGMDGLEFLKALAAAQPECARLVLSGQTDMTALVKMVNETHIYRFIPKPWHDYFLKSSLAQAIEFSDALRESGRLANSVRERGIEVPPLAGNGPEEILLVDPDAAVLDDLKHALSNHSETDDLFAAIRAEIAHMPGHALQESKNRITAVASAREAEKVAESKRFSCVLAGSRLSGMSGTELLQHFSDKQPDCARILVGEVSQNELIDAVDAAHIFGFVGKPWQDYELKACVAQALAYRRMAIENRMLAEMVKKAGGAA